MSALHGVGAPGSLYERCTSIRSTAWFGLADCCGRLARVLVAYYWLVATHPASFFVFLVRYNKIWVGPWLGPVVTLFYPFYPAIALALLLIKRAKNLVIPKKETWDDTNVFFTPPKGKIAALLWDLYKVLSPPCAQFLVNRGNTTAIAHSWQDTITVKDFWRRHLTDAGAQIPHELGRWDGAAATWHESWDGGRDIVVKLGDSYLGIGDSFLTDVTAADVETLLEKDYVNKSDTLILTWILPAGGYEVHSLDLLTIAQPDGRVEVCTALYWGDCVDGKSTHSSQAGYICDVAAEEIVATAGWYSPHFADMPQKPGCGVGLKLPGLREATRVAIEAHGTAIAEQPWLKMAGWDLIISRDGIVFFEGNFAQMRLPRRVFLAWGNTFKCLREWAPPFGGGHTASGRPAHQHAE